MFLRSQSCQTLVQIRRTRGAAVNEKKLMNFDSDVFELLCIVDFFIKSDNVGHIVLPKVPGHGEQHTCMGETIFMLGRHDFEEELIRVSNFVLRRHDFEEEL